MLMFAIITIAAWINQAGGNKKFIKRRRILNITWFVRTTGKLFQ